MHDSTPATPSAMEPDYESQRARFFRYVDKTETCWLWTSWVTGTYGGFRAFSQKFYAHRFSYTMHYGPIPPGMCVLHKCDVRLCVRPDHLFLGTLSDNNFDAVSKGRYEGQRFRRHLTHCKHWHEFTPENTYIEIVGAQRKRKCRACGRRRTVASALRRNLGVAI